MDNIMIVDDEQDTVQLMSETLGLWGYHPVTAGDGEEALAKFKETPIDLVITDLKLPKLDGVSLIDRIKSLNEQTEVIMCTGYPEVNTAVGAMKNGAYDYLVKPVDLNELKLKIERALERKKLRTTFPALNGLSWAIIISIPIWLALTTFIIYILRT